MGCCCSSTTNTEIPTAQVQCVVESNEISEIATGTTSAEVSTYKLNIHHRAAVVNDGYTKVEKSITGHFFISLEKNGERTYFGKYPKGGGPVKLILGREKIESKKEAECVSCLEQFEKEHNQKYLDTKTINLSEEQYDKAFEYAKSKSEGKRDTKMYVLGLADCADFVQSVYNAAELPLYFSSVYRRKELVSSLAGGKVLTAYGCLDRFISRFEKIRASNRKRLAEKLNVCEEYIVPLSGGYFFVDIDDALQRIMNQQDVHTTKTSRIFIYNLRVENMFNFVKVKLREQFAIKLTKVCEILRSRIAHYKWDTNVKFEEKVKEKIQLLKSRHDKELKEVNARLAKYELEVEKAISRGHKPLKKKRKKIKHLKELIKKKSDRYHDIEENFKMKLKSQLEGKMIKNTKREFEGIHNQMNRYKTPISEHINGLIDIGDENKISLSLQSYRVKLEHIARVLLENTSQKVEKTITQDFEIFFNNILVNVSTTNSKKRQRNFFKYFFSNKYIKIFVKNHWNEFLRFNK